MALKWADISSSEKYKSSAPEVKVKMQNAYFDRYVVTAPGYNPEWEPHIRQKLFATEPIKVQPEIRAPKPGEVFTPLTPQQESAIQTKRDIDLIKEFPNDLYSGSNAVFDSFAQGILPVRPKEMQRPGVEQAQPMANVAGEITGLMASMLATAPVEGYVRAMPIVQNIYKLGKTGTLLGKIGEYSARAVARGTHFAIAGGVKEMANQSFDLANKTTTPVEAAKSVGRTMVNMAELALPTSLAKPYVRAAATGTYGYAKGKQQGLSDMEAAVQGALFIGMELLDRSNFSVREKQMAYRKYMNDFNEIFINKRADNYDAGMAQAKGVVEKFGKTADLKAEIVRLRDEGRIVNVSDDEVTGIAQRIQGIWARQIKSAKVSKTSAALMTPEELLGAREPGYFLGITKEPTAATPQTVQEGKTQTERSKAAQKNFRELSKTEYEAQLRDAIAKGMSAEEWVGSQKIVYHGSPTGKKVLAEGFKSEYAGQRTKHSPEDVGIHFAESKKTARSYSEEYLFDIAEEIKLKGKEVPAGLKKDIERLKDAATIEAVLDIKNPMVVQKSKEINAETIRKAKNLGHDGIIALNDAKGERGDKEYVVFSPEQIKTKSQLLAEYKKIQEEMLVQEASKYKSVDEFIKDKGKSLAIGDKLFINSKAAEGYLRKLWKRAHGEEKLDPTSNKPDLIPTLAHLRANLGKDPDFEMQFIEKQIDSKTPANEIVNRLVTEYEIDTISSEFLHHYIKARRDGLVKTMNEFIGKPDKGGEPSDVLEKAKGLVPSGDAFAKQSIFWKGTIPIEEGEEYYKLRSIDTPELIRLARELTGLYPTVVKKTGNAAGRFYSKNGQIMLIADLFKQGNEQQAAIVLAHEIGHLVDWLPDNTLKRGNLLGRLLSLKEFRNTIIVSDEPVDIKQVTNQATKEVLKETGHTFGEMITGNLPQSVKDKIKARYLQKITQMGGIKDKDIKAELIKVTQYMHPFDIASAEAGYVSYRLSSKELYAEALSLLLNSPGTMEKMAPKFTKLFIDNLDRKPQVKEAYFDMLELFNGERADVLEGLDKDIRRMFAKADPLRSEKLAQKKVAKVSMFERLRQAVDNKYRPILKKVENLEKMGAALPPNQNPKYILEEYAMANNKIYEWCLKLDKSVKLELDSAKLTELDFGVYTFLKRIIGRPAEAVEETEAFDDTEIQQFANQFTDRKDMANPLGVDPKRAQEQLDFLKTKIGDEKFNKLGEIADNFHSLVFEVVEEAVKVGSYNKKVFEERIKPNKDSYVSFGVINYMQNYVSAGVKKQMGTLNEIENPFITTVLKTISLIKLNEKQRAVNSIRDMLKTYFPDEIKESKVIQKEGLRVFIDSPGSGRMQLLEDGRMASYDVDPYIAKSLEYDSTETSYELGKLIGTIFKNDMFKQLYITYNPGFALAFNPIRDFTRTYKNLNALGRKVTIRTLLYEYVKNSPSAWRRLRGINDELITEMVGNRALEINFDDYIEAYTDKSLSYGEILKRYGLAKTEEDASKLRKNMFVKPVVKALEGLRFIGSYLESISKISGYNILKQKDVYPMERAYITRNYIGTPNFRNKGLVTDTTNAIFMFSNIMKEGMKSDLYLATNPKTRSGYWWAAAKINLLPKLLMVLASAGLFGLFLKNFFEKVSEYDKTNYIIIPLGEHKGKAVYLRIPHDETGRLISALFWKVASAMKGKPEQLQQIFAFGAGQLPNLAPGIQLGTGWLTYLSGQNPYDNFRGRAIISDTEWKAGGWASLKKMVQWTANQSGQVSYATFDKDSYTTLEGSLQITPFFNRLLRISDYGITEELRQIKDKVQQENAKESLLKREEYKKGADLIEKGANAIDVLRGIKKSVYGNNPITNKEANILLKGLARETLKQKEDDPYVDALIYATSNEEKKAILFRMKKDAPLGEFKKTLKTLYSFKIFSDEVMTEDEWKELLQQPKG